MADTFTFVPASLPCKSFRDVHVFLDRSSVPTIQRFEDEGREGSLLSRTFVSCSLHFLVKLVVELMTSSDSSFLAAAAAACWKGFTTATRRSTSAGRRSIPGRRKRPSFLELSMARGGHFVDMVPNIIVPGDALPQKS